MPRVLVQGALIQCSHGGQLRLTVGDPRLTVADNGAVLSGMEAGLTFGTPLAPLPGLAPCPAQTPTMPPTFVPCVTSPAAAGMAVNLTVGETPALLDSATGVTVSGAGPAQWSVADAGQTMLEAA